MYQNIVCFADMGRHKNSLPSLLHHKPSDQARVIWQGETIYLGRWGSVEVVQAYDGICANITRHGCPVWIPANQPKLTTLALCLEYSGNLPKNYPAGSGEPAMIDLAIRWLPQLFADLPAESFSPAKLLELRQAWIDSGKSHSTINKWHNYILGLFRWAAMTDRLPASVWHSLLTVPKLKKGRSAAVQPKDVGPVTRAQVEAVKAAVDQRTRDMIDLQLLTGMRTGDVLQMTTNQIANGVYTPVKHKTAWRGHKRQIYLGPAALAIVARVSAGKGPDDPLFKWSACLYGQKIARACKRLGVAHWHPHQLRHLAGSEVRDVHGLDAAQAFLGHSSAKMSEHYAKVKGQLGKQAAEERE